MGNREQVIPQRSLTLPLSCYKTPDPQLIESTSSTEVPEPQLLALTRSYNMRASHYIGYTQVLIGPQPPLTTLTTSPWSGPRTPEAAPQDSPGDRFLRQFGGFCFYL